MKNLKKKYEEAKATALDLMFKGSLAQYIEKLAEAEQYRLQMIAVKK